MIPISEHDAKTIRLHKSDNVVIALQDLSVDTVLSDNTLPLADRIMRGHKIATVSIAQGQNVVRYGQTIGVVTTQINPGQHVHTHNMGMGVHNQDYAFSSDINKVEPAKVPRGFMGYHRKDGRVGTRNYLGILTSVNCAGSVAKFIVEAAEQSSWLKEMENLDGIMPIVHGTGCGMSSKHEGYDTLFRTLTGYARHPNFAGILLVGLGCKVMQIADLVGAGRIRDKNTFRYMTIQQTGGTRRTIEGNGRDRQSGQPQPGTGFSFDGRITMWWF